MRAYLDHQVDFEVGQRLDSGGKRHRLAGVASPVGSVKSPAGFQRPTGQVADVGQVGGADTHVVQGGLQGVKSGFYQNTVEGSGGVKPSGPDSRRFEVSDETIDRSNRAAYHLVSPVVGGYA